jgi:hypothetical protein
MSSATFSINGIDFTFQHTSGPFGSIDAITVFDINNDVVGTVTIDHLTESSHADIDGGITVLNYFDQDEKDPQDIADWIAAVA